jgi:hypothetical protein
MTANTITTEEDGADAEDEVADAAASLGDGKAIDLHRLLRAQRNKLLSDQRADHEAQEHPDVLGDAGEVNWAEVIDRFLSKRYVVSTKAFVIDCDGRKTPQQIDVLIHDRHFCPLWFENKAHTRYVPAESVFAAFEVKPRLDKGYVEYAAEKLRSVRELRRTSAPIVDKGVPIVDKGVVQSPREPRTTPIGRQQHKRGREREQRLLAEEPAQRLLAPRTPQLTRIAVTHPSKPAGNRQRPDPRTLLIAEAALDAGEPHRQRLPPTGEHVHREQQTTGDKGDARQQQREVHRCSPVRRGSGIRPSRRISK